MRPENKSDPGFTSACVLALLTLLAIHPATRADPVPDPFLAPTQTIFNLPAAMTQYAAIAAAANNLLKTTNYPAAESQCRHLVETFPANPTANYNWACVLARLNRTNEAMTALKKAVSSGFREHNIATTDPDLAPLRNHTSWSNVLATMRSAPPPQQPAWSQATPTTVHNGIALVAESNTWWDQRIGILRTCFTIPSPNTNLPPPHTPNNPALTNLYTWISAGSAAGNYGDLYDNHDNGHSCLDTQLFPGITRVTYSPAAKAAQIHNGLQNNLLFDKPVLGNASEAVVGNLPRSLPRLALSSQRNLLILSLQYLNNHLYVYPEHTDHDTRTSDSKPYNGDLFPANVPYFVVSQGSSGSDQPFLTALAATLAAFPPTTKKALIDNNLLAPTLQALLRSSSTAVREPDQYFTGSAHPTVFEPAFIDLRRMLQAAHSMTPTNIPPLACIRVTREQSLQPGVDIFEPPESELLFNSPCAIARIHRNILYRRKMTVDASDSRTLNNHALSYRWAVLRGDPASIVITPLDRNYSRVQLDIPYHQPRRVQPGSTILSSRVDIGLFVGDGSQWSAPAFISIFYPPTEDRTYDSKFQPLTITYDHPQLEKFYFDPLLRIRKNWSDSYSYAPDGTLLGWQRDNQKTTTRYNAKGQLLPPQNSGRTQAQPRPVRYLLTPEQTGGFTLIHNAGD